MKGIGRVAGVVLMCGALPASQAQSVTVASGQASVVRERVERLPAKAHMTVIPMTGPAEFGNLVSHDADGFTMYDVDRKVEATLRYDQVKSVHKGYGGCNGVRGHHVDRRKQIIVVAVVLGALGALTAAAVAAK